MDTGSGYTGAMPRIPAVVVPGPGPAELRELSEADLPDEPVTVEVRYSSLNYKDGLAVTGRGKVVRSFPMTCGVDLAGTVVSSADPSLAPGDEVVVTGWGLGERHAGGYTTLQRVRPEWTVRPPEGLDLRRCMAVGTAGLTAMLCVLALERGGLQSGTDAPVLVTGASGGVGSLAVALLASAGHHVVASTGRRELEAYLTALGASEVIDRSSLSEPQDAPLQREHWAGVVDTVGSATLANAIAQTRYGGTVAACGLAGGSDLPTSVFPFILRGVTLAGIDSVMCPTPERVVAWERIAAQLPAERLDAISETRPMSDIFDLAGDVLAGAVRGRVVVDPRR